MVILYIYSTCWRIKLVFYERQQARGWLERLMAVGWSSGGGGH
jgi:hypothetical protein